LNFGCPVHISPNPDVLASKRLPQRSLPSIPLRQALPC